jgi:glycerophosphoryl diester phosphodiesterase/lysophospholipase L1-like esterase
MVRVLSPQRAGVQHPALRPLQAALANRHNAPCRIVVWGDSVSEGEGVATFSQRWVNRWQDALRAAYPVPGVRGGVGYLPVYYLSASIADPVVQDSSEPNGGTPTFTVDAAYGFGGRSLRLTRGAALVWTQECTSFRVHYAKGPFGVNFTVQVDGVQVASVATNQGSLQGGFVWDSTSVTTLKPGPHTIRVRTVDSAGFISVIEGVDFRYGDESKGIHVYDASRSGAPSTGFGAGVFANHAGIAPVHCVITELLANDALIYSRTPTQYATDLLTHIDAVDTSITNPYSHVLLYMPQPNGTVTATYTWNDFLIAAEGAARQRGQCLLINASDWMGPTVAGDTLSLWADGVHANAKGNAFIAEGLSPALGVTGSGLPLSSVVPDRPDLVGTLLTGGGYVWHRGGGDVHPEHTLEAYLLAQDKGGLAIEVSAQRAKDGALFCLHDVGSTGLERTTSLTGDIKDRYSIELLRTPIVDYGTTYLGAAWPSVHLPLVSFVLDQLVGKVVIFFEPKDAGTAASTAMLDLIRQYAEPGKSIVWKYFREASGAPPNHALSAQAAGLRQWVYMDAVDSDSLIGTVAAYADIIGMPVEASDAKITTAVGTGTPVMVWAVRRRWERTRLAGLGVGLFMCTNPEYVSTSTAARTTDAFHVGARIAGDLPCSDSWLPTYDAATGTVALQPSTSSGLVLGSMCPIANAVASYEITFAFQWPQLPGDTSTHADVFFGHADDRPYVHQGTSNVGGYHLVARANGQWQLYSHAAGSGTGTQLATQTNTAIAAGAWVTGKITVTPSDVTIQRTDLAGTPLTVANTTYRGGYFGITSGSSSTATLWQNVAVNNI